MALRIVILSIYLVLSGSNLFGAQSIIGKKYLSKNASGNIRKDFAHQLDITVAKNKLSSSRGYYFEVVAKGVGQGDTWSSPATTFYLPNPIKSGEEYELVVKKDTAIGTYVYTLNVSLLDGKELNISNAKYRTKFIPKSAGLSAENNKLAKALASTYFSEVSASSFAIESRSRRIVVE